jgi:O-antigen ligase
MAIGAAYIGWEVTVNDRGSLSGARLEGIGAAGVANANQLASLMATILPLTGGLFLTGNRLEKVGAVIVAPLILNVLLLCNSRGAFLASIAGGITFLFAARGPARAKAKQGLVLGAAAIFLLLGDPAIVERFSSIFVSAEERDNSASSRLVLWAEGFDMISDNPLGAGGDAYANYGEDSRPVHNGYITEAADWGVQGFALRMLFLASALAVGWRTTRSRMRLQDGDAVVLGACLLTAATAYLGPCAFGDFIDEEWGFWTVGLLVAYWRLYGATMDAPATAGTVGLTRQGLLDQSGVTAGFPSPHGAALERRTPAS